MDDDYFRDVESRGHDNLFLWTVFILLLIGFAMACWLGTFYIFGHPENPRSYKILRKLKKIDSPKRFEVTAAPLGKFRTAKQLYDEYNTYTRLQLDQENAALIRNYINNYQSTKLLVPYIIGRFTILNSYELRQSNMFPSGVVALGQASDYPPVLIEYVYTSPQANVPLLLQMLQSGLDIKLERTLDLSAVIHVARTYDGRLQFTVVPLLYGTYALKQATGSFSLEPPAELNMEGGVPIIGTSRLDESFRVFADHNRGKEPGRPGPKVANASASTTPETTELVRVETPTPIPTPGPTHAGTPKSSEITEVETPIPMTPTPPTHLMASQTETPSPVEPTPQPEVTATPRPRITPAAATSTPPLLTVRNYTPRPTAQPTIAISRPIPSAAPVAHTSNGVPLQPFLVAAPTPNTTTAIGTWRTFSPGQMPRGRVVEVPETAGLAERGVGSERLYLRGSFLVTAVVDGRAVLRPHAALGPNLVPFNSHPSGGSPRIIAEFPAGTNPPTEGSTFSRDESRAFQITDVRRGADGQVNIYVREITTPL